MTNTQHQFMLDMTIEYITIYVPVLPKSFLLIILISNLMHNCSNFIVLTDFYLVKNCLTYLFFFLNAYKVDKYFTYNSRKYYFFKNYDDLHA